jgi:prolyl-tRNA editing enzyme YbaK/EbsC (Cys-tRNA(Pro) deacylase)
MKDSILLPAVQKSLDDLGIKYTVLACDPELADTAVFCEHYNLPIDQAANTIIVMSRKVEPVKYAVCVVLGTHRLDVNKKVCQLMGVKKTSFADAETTIKLSGMLIGGVTVFGINMPIYIDAAVMERPEVVLGGGNRSSKLLLMPNELKKLPNAQVVEGLAAPKKPE